MDVTARFAEHSLSLPRAGQPAMLALRQQLAGRWQ